MSKIQELTVEETLDSLKKPGQVATAVQVSGDSGMITLSFFYLPQKLVEHYLDHPEEASVEENLLVVRQEPICKVMLPIASVLEMMSSLVSEIGQKEIPGIKESLVHFAPEGISPGEEDD
jgi:hypothetical protein